MIKECLEPDVLCLKFMAEKFVKESLIREDLMSENMSEKNLYDKSQNKKDKEEKNHKQETQTHTDRDEKSQNKRSLIKTGLDEERVRELTQQSANVRRRMISTAYYCHNRIHWGSALSCVEILLYVIGERSDFASKQDAPGRKDMVIVSKGQASLAYYSVLAELGVLPEDFVKEYQKNGTVYTEELMKRQDLLTECTTGSLGLGLSFATGRAIRAQLQKQSRNIYCILGDGELDEGSVWEAVMLAAQKKLDQLFMIVDFNGLQSDGPTEEIIQWNRIVDQLSAFGWTVHTADGHDYRSLSGAFDIQPGKPTAVIARTVKGKGISFMENDYLWHDRLLDTKLLAQAEKEVGLSGVS